MRLPGFFRPLIVGLLWTGFLLPPAANAQDETAEAPPEEQETAETPAGAEGDVGDSAAALAAATAEAEGAPAPDAAASEYERPVLVIPIRQNPDRVPAEATGEVAVAVAARLGPAAKRREVTALDDPETLAKFANCPTEAPPEGEEGMTPEQCLGAGIALSGGEAGIVVRLDRRRARRAPYQATITVHARRSGEVVGGPVEVELPQEGDYDALLAEPLGALEGSMPPPPPRQFLTIATNTDGAEVRVDGEPIGETPVAPVELKPGQHIVQVAREGVGAENRTVQMRPGQDLRINVDFDPDETVGEGTRYDWETGELVQEEKETPWYLRWYTIAGAAAVVVGAVVIGVVVATQDDEQPGDPIGQPIPPIQEQ